MKEKFFDKLDWSSFWSATVVTFVVYFLTLGPSVGLEDSGELATAAANLGVPHPPGYPFWTFCSWLFCKAFSWVTYMGHPTPAWCVSLCSAVFGAFAAGFTAMLICRSARDFLGEDGADGNNRLLSFGGGVAGALAFALSPVEWSQSTIVEIYSLNAFFLMGVFLLSYRWMKAPSDRILWLTAFVFGLGLTNYQVLLFAIVPLTLIIAMKNIGLFRDVFIYLAPIALTYQVLKIGCLLRADENMSSDVINKHLPVTTSTACPSSAVLTAAFVLLLLAMTATILLKNRKRGEEAKRVMLAGGGLATLLVVLAATVFAGTQTWSGVAAAVAPLIAPQTYAFVAAAIVGSVTAAVVAALVQEEGKRLWQGASLPFFVTAGALALAAVLIAANVPQAGNLGYRGPVYPWGKSTAAFWGVLVLFFALAALTRKGLCFAVPAAGLQIAAFLLLRAGAMNGLTHPCSWWFCWPIVWNFVLLVLAWATLPNGRSVAGAAFFAQLGVSFYVYMPIVSDLRNPPMNWGYPRTWEGFKHALMRGQYEAIGFRLPTWGGIAGYLKDVLVQFTDLIAVLALVPFVIGHWIVQKTSRRLFWQWMIAAASCFFLMSVLLIGLANVKGDIQDGFIQKVKFISSHAMIALWIGYGLVFAAAAVLGLIGRKTRTGRKSIACVLVALMIAGAAVTPLVQNYCDNQLVFELGGSEQNGHTFGWQFGAYQLEGASAIKAQLTADEEPLPDPDWPERMEDFSIFFGGTDPGRFVPTYMIYSAKFRPDVYLITQNALADNTYMAVERDLYGDEIWIPSNDDSAEAFNIYVDEVKRGVRQANGDLKIENGRVQVTGALGVMEINGILTKMMFDHDRLRHSFYIEESYVIPWMYPYLSPHGLIMKINKDPTPYQAKTAQKDRDFWDWYTRRLLKDPMYRRDFAGQKSFSKLRAALAGLYVKQGRWDEAAQAYREAVLLYPASPEATFRYAQEILLPMQNWETTLELLDFTDSIDPANARTRNLRGFILNVRTLKAVATRLEPKARANTLTRAERIELASAYYQLGRMVEAGRLVQPLVETENDLSNLRLIATILLATHQDGEAEKVITRFVRKAPSGDPQLWIDLAKIQYKTGRRSAAVGSFSQALQNGIDRAQLSDRLGKDEDLMQIYLAWYKTYQAQQQSQKQQQRSLWK